MPSHVVRSFTGACARAFEALEPRWLLSIGGHSVTIGNATLSDLVLSPDRSGAAVGAVGTKVIFAGGTTHYQTGDVYADWWNPGASSNAVDIFDTATGRLSSGAPMPSRITHRLPAAVTAGGKMIVYGSPGADPILVYDVAANAWSTLNEPAGAGTPLGAVGNDVLFGTTAAPQVYDAATDQWTPLALHAPYQAMQIIGHDAYFFEAGGWVETLDANSGALTSRQVAADANFGGAHGAVDGKIVFAGGSTATSGDPDGGVYDVATGAWTPQTTGVLSEAGVAVVGDKVIFAGGQVPSGVPSFPYPNGSAAVHLYDASTGQWSDATLSGGRYGLEAFTIGHDAFFVGGSAGFDGIFANVNVDIYDDSTGTWSSAARPSNWWDTTYSNFYSSDPVYAGDDVIMVGDGGVDVYSPSPLLPPAALSPAPGAGLAAAPAKLSWGAVAGAQTYDVYLDQALVSSTADTNWSVDRAIAPGLHTWQVLARDAGGDVTQGPRWAFTVGAPSAPFVRSGAKLAQSPASFSCGAVAGATRYSLYVDGRRVASTTGQAVNLVLPLAGGTHTWSVVAYNALTSAAGPTWTFSLPAPPLSRAVTVVPEQRKGPRVQAVTAGNQVLVFGGSDDPGVADTADVYDIPSSTWSKTYIPGRLLPIGTTVLDQWASCGDDAVFVGSGRVAIYNSRIGRWTTHPLSVVRSGMTIARVGDEIVLAGGLGHSGAASDAVELYNMVTGQWTTARLSVARAGMAAAVLGDKLYLAGGGSAAEGSLSDVVSAAVDVFDASTGTWSTAAVSQARQGMVGAVAAGRYVIFAAGFAPGNSSSGPPQDRLDVFDTQTGTWSTDQFPTGAYLPGVQAVGIGPRAYFVAEDSAGSGAVIVYDPATRAWAQQALPPNTANYNMTAVGRNLLIENNTLSITVFDTKTGRVTYAPMPGGGVGPQAVTVTGRAVFVGGAQAGAHAGPEVDVYTDPTVAPSLSASFARTPADGTITPGRSDTVSVTVRAAANTSLSGRLKVTVYASPSPTVEHNGIPLGTATVLPTSTRRGASQVIDVPVQIPPYLSGGPYYLVASVTMTGARAVIASDRPILHLPTVKPAKSAKSAARSHPATAWESQ